jgi:hypothetical protein
MRTEALQKALNERELVMLEKYHPTKIKIHYGTGRGRGFSHTSKFSQTSAHSISGPVTCLVLTIDRFMKDRVYNIIIKAKSPFESR